MDRKIYVWIESVKLERASGGNLLEPPAQGRASFKPDQAAQGLVPSSSEAL